MINPEATPTERPSNVFKAHGCYKVSKIKEKDSDCQDSYSLSTDRSRVAISDGATQSFYSGLWSQILCNLYCSWPKLISHSQWNDWNDAARSEWIEEVNNKLEELKEAGKPSWIECLNGIKLKKDAFATFIGISLEGSYLHGICIGDSCAMLVKQSPIDPDSEGCQEDDSIIRIFPGLWRHSFDSRTTGLSSYNSESNHLPEFFHIPVPVDKADYLILLMTDALAKYVIEMEERGMSILSNLLSLGTPEEFNQFIDKCRHTGLANDDTTLVVVEITDTADSSEIEKRQGDIDSASILPSDNRCVEVGSVDSITQDSNDQSLEPPVDPPPGASPPSVAATAEAQVINSEIHVQQESCTLSQANISPDGSDQRLTSDNAIPEQAVIDNLNRSDNDGSRILATTVDKDKMCSSSQESPSLPSFVHTEDPRKKKSQAVRLSSNPVINAFWQVYQVMKSVFPF